MSGWQVRPAPSKPSGSLGRDRAPSAPRRPPFRLSELSPPLRPSLPELPLAAPARSGCPAADPEGRAPPRPGRELRGG
eukprot:10608386-Lingulodinium_polyedra.AAC.1